MNDAIVQLAYLVAATLFVFAIKGLGHPRTALRGNRLGSLGMLIAVAVTLVDARIVRYEILAAGLAVGGALGLWLALRTSMTALPQLVALFNGVGGGASVLVAGAALSLPAPSLLAAASGSVSGFVGALTFSGSLVATGKLSGALRFRPRSSMVSRFILLALAVGIVWAVLRICQGAMVLTDFGWLALVSLLFGLALVLPVGGGDMPVVVSFLNACSGLAAAATGFVLLNQALIISGSLVGASGFILTGIMCRAMNRSLRDVFFGRMSGDVGTGAGESEDQALVKTTSPDEVAMMIESARRIIVVPGYGMAVAQAQHTIADLARELQALGIRVDFAIHPVAGRLPGHMNVLLAEADVPYEQLFDLEAINAEFGEADIALVVGANDVVNPSARTDSSSSLYGMPILNADRARSTVVLKRSLAPGFAGVTNPLFTAPNTVMLFGDAKDSLVAIAQALVEASD